MKKILWTIFWGLFVLSTLSAMLFLEPPERLRQFPFWMQILMSHLMLLPFWFILLRFRSFFSGIVRSIPLPSVVKFLIAGLLLGVGLGVNFTIAFGLSGGYSRFENPSGIAGADLDPNPLINIALYFGPWGGAMLGWYFLRRFYTFSFYHVFWIAGILGALTEQQFLLPATLLSGDILTALSLTFLLIPSYGVPYATPFVIMPPEELPKGVRKPGLLGYLLFVIIPLIMFYVSAILYYKILDLIFSTKFCC